MERGRLGLEREGDGRIIKKIRGIRKGVFMATDKIGIFHLIEGMKRIKGRVIRAGTWQRSGMFLISLIKKKMVSTNSEKK